MVVVVVTMWRELLVIVLAISGRNGVSGSHYQSRQNNALFKGCSSWLLRCKHPPATLLSLRAGGSSYNSNAVTATNTTGSSSNSRTLRPLRPLTRFRSHPPTTTRRSTALVRKHHWNDRIKHFRGSVWETQKSLGTALLHLRKKSLEHEEKLADNDISFYDALDSDNDEDCQRYDDRESRTNYRNDYKIDYKTDYKPRPKSVRTISSSSSSSSLGGRSSEPAKDFLDDVVGYSNKLPLEEWGFFGISSFLSLVTSIYCYGLVSRNLHWDWSINDYNTFDYTSYGLLEWSWKVAPDILCLTTGTAGMLSGLYATCIYSLLAFHGRLLAIQHQLNNPLYHYRTQALVENFLQRTIKVRQRGFRSFRASLYSLGIQIPLLVMFRLPSWLPMRVAVMLLLTLIVSKILWDAQSILARPSPLSAASLTADYKWA